MWSLHMSRLLHKFYFYFFDIYKKDCDIVSILLYFFIDTRTIIFNDS